MTTPKTTLALVEMGERTLLSAKEELICAHIDIFRDIIHDLRLLHETFGNGGWMAIESAPKDGRSIFIFTEHGNTIEAFWNSEQQVWQDTTGFMWYGHEWWMPLRQPPKSGE